MKTILKVYRDFYGAKKAIERDACEAVLTGQKYKFGESDRTLEVGEDVKIIYKKLSEPHSVFRGMLVDEIYFDDSVNEHARIGIEGTVKIRGNEETPKEGEEFYYVVEDKIGEITRILRTNDKSFVEALFRENR